jgi:hypothetical protein
MTSIINSKTWGGEKYICTVFTLHTLIYLGWTRTMNLIGLIFFSPKIYSKPKKKVNKVMYMYSKT